MAVIRVPKPPRKAYNPGRPAGTLLQSQLRHLEWAVRPAAERTKKSFKIRKPRTEGEAAARIAALTVELDRQATAPRQTAPVPPAPPVKTRKRKARRTRRAAPKSRSTRRPRRRTRR